MLLSQHGSCPPLPLARSRAWMAVSGNRRARRLTTRSGDRTGPPQPDHRRCHVEQKHAAFPERSLCRVRQHGQGSAVAVAPPRDRFLVKSPSYPEPPATRSPRNTAFASPRPRYPGKLPPCGIRGSAAAISPHARRLSSVPDRAVQKGRALSRTLASNRGRAAIPIRAWRRQRSNYALRESASLSARATRRADPVITTAQPGSRPHFVKQR